MLFDNFHISLPLIIVFYNCFFLCILQLEWDTFWRSHVSLSLIFFFLSPWKYLQLACRDYPHPRHLCANFPFSSSLHEKYCELVSTFFAEVRFFFIPHSDHSNFCLSVFFRYLSFLLSMLTITLQFSAIVMCVTLQPLAITGPMVT